MSSGQRHYVPAVQALEWSQLVRQCILGSKALKLGLSNPVNVQALQLSAPVVPVQMRQCAGRPVRWAAPAVTAATPVPGASTRRGSTPAKSCSVKA